MNLNNPANSGVAMNATYRAHGGGSVRDRSARTASRARKAVGILTIGAVTATSLVAVGIGSVVGASASAAEVVGGPTPRNTTAAVMAGTFNINHGRSGLGASAQRLNGITAEIRRAGFDVVGLQEAATEMRDKLIPRLRPTYAYSLLGDSKGRNSTGGQIFYKPDVLTPGSIAGIIELPSPSNSNQRSGLYQDFYHRATGAHFLFTSVHLSNLAGRAASDVRHAQATRLMDGLNSVNRAGLPLVLAGDMNSNAASKYVYDAPRRVYHGNGLSEVFDRAATKVNAKYNSFNHLQATPRLGGYRPDQIYVAGKVGVQYAETMVRLVTKKVKVRKKGRVIKKKVKRYKTPFVSDHSAIRAIVQIPPY